MNLFLFDYHLPTELIAQTPAPDRDSSRLLAADRGNRKITDGKFSDIVDLLDSRHFLVLNNTKVLPARIPAAKPTGGKSEIFYLESLGEKSFKAMVRGRFRAGSKLLAGNETIVFKERVEDGLWILRATCSCDDLLRRHGKLPLPPYIQREPNEDDNIRYQTIYAKEEGSVAAPTAGLHFTDDILERLRAKGVEIVYITLHVGIGTFRPIKTENLAEHKMHAECYHVSREAADKINSLVVAGKILMAVGTTSVRTLESAAVFGEDGWRVSSGYGNTELFITPDYEFKLVRGMVTNFHLPKSSLFVLVSGFMGMDFARECYEHAVNAQYRFFSYGDAMVVV